MGQGEGIFYWNFGEWVIKVVLPKGFFPTGEGGLPKAFPKLIPGFPNGGLKTTFPNGVLNG